MHSINNLFKNENKIILFLIAGPIVIGLMLTFILPLTHKFDSIDSCLDKGGSFNYELCECDFQISHPVPENHKCK